MITVYYSLVCDEDCTHEAQWARSVTSLRRHNRTVSVVLCLWGPARPHTIETAARCGVRILHLDPYPTAFGDVPDHWRATLATYPTMHKLPALLQLLTEVPSERYVYLDCDTYLYGDVTAVGHGPDLDWVAREEPGTRRSRHGYDPAYLDEDALLRLAEAEGLVAVPPYNTGVFVLDSAVARTLVSLLDDFVWYAWRLLLGAALWRPQLFADPGTAARITGSSARSERSRALPYPSSNLWIFEQIATWLVLGRVPGVRHATLPRSQVVQSDEFLTEPPGYIVAHYFSVLQDRFVDHLIATGAPA